MVLEVQGLNKSYKQGDGSFLNVLKSIDFKLKKGEKVAIMGESGSGKTTFLNCITGLDISESKSLKICGKDISKLKEKELSKLRNKNIGFVFQFHYLLKDFTVLENVMMPCLIAGVSKTQAKDKACEMLSNLGLLSKVNVYPSFISGGEQQRVAIARALVNSPNMLVMDEPTGNLDENLSYKVISYVLNICNNRDISIVVATHNAQVASRMDKICKLAGGELI